MADYSNQDKWPIYWGHQQSPIDINSSRTVAKESLRYQVLKPYRLMTEIDDHSTIRLVGDGGIMINGNEWSFNQVHFHCPSDHLIDGKSSPLEIHLVHSNSIGQIMVLSLMIQLGDNDKGFGQIIDKFKHANTVPIKLEITNWLDNNDPHGFHYLGSLTTPPLIEGVEWIIVTNPSVTISKEQLLRYQELFLSNNRDIQDLEGRPVTKF